MFLTSFDENKITGLNRTVLAADSYRPPALNNVINLVLGVRPLRIGSVRRQKIDARAHRRNAKKFRIRTVLLLPVGDYLWEMESLHERKDTTTVDAVANSWHYRRYFVE